MIPKKFKVPIGQFPREHRVLFRDDFLSVRAAENQTGYNRLGVNFRSKAFKTAVQRNRLRRLVFDSVGADSPFFARPQPQASFDLLITLNPAILTLTNEVLRAKIKTHVNITRITPSPARKPPGFSL